MILFLYFSTTFSIYKTVISCKRSWTNLSLSKELVCIMNLLGTPWEYSVIQTPGFLCSSTSKNVKSPVHFTNYLCNGNWDDENAVLPLCWLLKLRQKISLLNVQSVSVLWPALLNVLSFLAICFHDTTIILARAYAITMEAVRSEWPLHCLHGCLVDTVVLKSPLPSVRPLLHLAVIQFCIHYHSLGGT